MKIIAVILFLFQSVGFFCNAQTLDFNDTTFRVGDSLVRNQIYNPNCQIELESISFIDSLAHFLKKYNSIVITIEFHSDLRGNDIANQNQGEVCGINRMTSYYQDLYPTIDLKRIKFISYDESKPLMSRKRIDAIKDEEEKELAHSKNRRTVVRIIQTGT